MPINPPNSQLGFIWSKMETDQETMVSSFLEIAVGQTAETAIQFLILIDTKEICI